MDRRQRRGRPPHHRGELAARLGLGAPATTSLIDRLQDAGHVERIRDPRDRRRITLSMNDTALEMARSSSSRSAGAWPRPWSTCRPRTWSSRQP
ncbi:MarR family transcriptional regulator [Catellatospora coxensis]